MKKYILILSSLFLVFSCTDEDYKELNQDPINPTEVSALSLYNQATVSLFDQMESTNVNRNIFRMLSQYWTETTYTDEANFDLNNRSIPDTHWSILYRNVLFNLKDAKQKIMDDAVLSDSEKTGRVGQIEILEVYTWQILVDTFGDIPYTQALLNFENLTPEYDDAATIYSDLFTRLDAAIAKTSSGSGFGDVNYNGDMDAWTMLGNSLKLKMAMRIADVNPGTAQSKAVEAVNAGVFMSNEDNFTIPYQTASPNTNPLWEDLVQSGRSDFVVANTIVDYLNELNDPRRSEYFDNNLEEGYVGGPYGDNNSFTSYTHIGAKMHDPTFRGQLMDFSEVSFYLAEAAARGWAVGGSAEEHYNNGIMASMNDWGISESAAMDYLNQSSVAWNTAEGDWKQKIGMQMWIAMYNRGFEGWSTWRKFDYPPLNLPAISELPVPLRYTYPQDEQTLNRTNWTAASTAIGGDEQQTPIFWDVN